MQSEGHRGVRTFLNGFKAARPVRVPPHGRRRFRPERTTRSILPSDPATDDSGQGRPHATTLRMVRIIGAPSPPMSLNRHPASINVPWLRTKMRGGRIERNRSQILIAQRDGVSLLTIDETRRHRGYDGSVAVAIRPAPVTISDPGVRP